MHSTDYAVARFPSVCPSVCLSHTSIVSKSHKHIIKLFSPSGSHTILHTKRYGNTQTGTLLTGAYEQIVIFNKYLALSQKWHKIGPQLQWNVNRKPYPSFNMVYFQWPSVTSNPDFKVTTFWRWVSLKQYEMRETFLQWNACEEFEDKWYIGLMFLRVLVPRDPSCPW